MKTFAEYLAERVVNIGLKAEDSDLRHKHADEIHSMLHHAYKSIGGYGGLGSGSEKEKSAIHADIHDARHTIKLHKRGDHLSHVSIYKMTKFGRKKIASATDRSEQGKKDYVQGEREDIRQADRHAYSEVSHAPEAIKRKLGAPIVPNDKVSEILNKKIEPDANGEHYVRELGGTPHRKVMMGNPKI